MATLTELEYEQISPRLLELLRRLGYTSLTRFQKETVDAGLIRGKSNLLVTYDYDEAYEIAEIAVLNMLAMDIRARAIILCPNPHLVEKRLKSLRPKCYKLGIETKKVGRRRTAIDKEWKSGRLVVASFHSLSIALRSHPEMLEGVKCILIERLDLIGDPKIGPRLETAIVTMKMQEIDPQFIAVLPPVADLDDLGEWINAAIVRDDKSEVKRIFSVKAFESVNQSIIDLTEFVHYKHGRIMILCSNIDTCESLAIQLAGLGEGSDPALELRLKPEDKDILQELAAEVAKSYSDAELTNKLVATLQRGISFLHEGIPRKQRRTISREWEKGHIPVLVMPTRFAIASGLRASAVFVIGTFIQDLGNDLSNGERMTLLTEWQLSEVLYSAGRSGIDTEGFGIVVVDSEVERQRVLEKYFVTEDEGIIPRLGEVDSLMDDPENVQDLVLSQMCRYEGTVDNPFKILDQTYWAARNRVTDIHEKVETGEELRAEMLITLRATNSTLKRAKSIPDSAVKLVSVTPSKIEGLVHSGSREIWHYVTLRATEGLSCSCESWKYQGVSRHRLCKHLVKFSHYALQQEETKAYAASVIRQALRGLGIIDELESEGLVVREQNRVRCTEVGESVVMLGIPVADAKRALKAIRKQRGGLKSILTDITIAKTGLPKTIVEHIIEHLPAERLDDMICKEDLPGIVENVIEEVQYTNSIILGIMSGEARKGLHREAFALHKNLSDLLDDDS